VDLAPPTVPALRIVDLLPEPTAQLIHDVACARAPMFQASDVAAAAGPEGLQSQAAPEYRTSHVLLECPEVFPWFLALARKLLPFACERLLLPPFYPLEAEIQLTAHGEGGFFKTHLDNGTYRLHRRAVSYVYYFGDRGYPFNGGELVFHNPGPAGMYGAPASITPEWNSIVFFPSGLSHEVCPVHAPPDFRLGRFTINGWLSR
jgi:SM-20-related protein